MSATDESQNLDAGWDNEPAEDEVDQAWDSLPPPTSAPSAPALSVAPPSAMPATEEVDGGWDDAPAGTPQTRDGKRRPHRQRRAKSNAMPAAANPVLLPRPAEPTKKHQRELARQQRLHEAKVKHERKAERKAQRAAEAREQAEARLRQTEAEERARKMRREARERAESERPAVKPPKSVKSSQKASAKQASARAGEPKPDAVSERASRKSGGLRPAVIVTLLLLAGAVAFLVLRK